MANILEKRKENRFKFLHRLYELTDTNRLASVSMWDIGNEFDLEQQETHNITDYLEGEGLLEYAALGGWIEITHYGILEVEQALSSPQEPTEHFPPVVNIIHVQSMTHSQIQQGNIDSTQTGKWTAAQTQELRDFLAHLEGKLDALSLAPDDEAEARVDVTTIKAQLESPRPHQVVIVEMLKSIRTILEKAAGSIVAEELIRQITQFL